MTIYFIICCDTSVTTIVGFLFIVAKPFSFNTLLSMFKSNILDKSGFAFPRNPKIKASLADL